MTQPAQKAPLAEGVMVLAAAAIMALGLGGVVVWQSGRTDMDSGGEDVEAAAARQEELATARRELEQARQELEQEQIQRMAAETKAEEAVQAGVEVEARADLMANDSRLQLGRLRKENEELRADLLALRERPAPPVESGDETTADAESFPTPPPPVGIGSRDIAPRALNAARVVDANEALQYVVLDVGSDQGVRPGMQFSVLEGDQVLAQLRAEDVRETLSGAVVERVVGERFPTPDDRAIVTRHVER